MSESSSSSSAAAVMAPSAAAVMAPPPAPKYDVFFSFQGEDTGKNFTSHLHAALRRKKVETFIDDRSLETSDELCKAIEDSMIYVTVFSEHYASSRWCLDELVKIMDCRVNYGRVVIPIFYHVDPSTVRKQNGSYADAFVEHENRLVPKEVMQKWRDALTHAANIAGYDINGTRSESMLIDRIAEDILKKLNRSVSCDTQGMVGIDKHIAQILSLLQLESAAVRIIGIWGMGGIGKTTLARAVYHKLRNQFHSISLVENAQQEIDRDGTYHLRQKYLSQLGFPDERLKRANVLLILDDVKISSQVQELIGGHGNFGQGSRIIVTSRDMQVLKNANADAVYEVKGMSYQDSLELFRLNAFKEDYPPEGYAKLIEEVLKYAKGVPLALQVLGSLLYDKEREVWESELEKLKELPHVDIFDVLKLSYDGLDDEEKDIFLDIACLFVGWDEDEVVDLIDACGFCAKAGVDVLKDRGLISILKDQVVVHDLLREMGKDIVHQQCANDPGKRSRLWDREQIYNVLKKNKVYSDALHPLHDNSHRIQILIPMSGSSSSSAAALMAPLTKYDVFLSFQGQDTRNNFTSHLYSALCRTNVKTFIDDRLLNRGDENSLELCKAIEQSTIYVIVFSEHYASSRWCLDELVKIMECKKNYERAVIPIFYHVDPSTVRYQKGSYAGAFVEHEKRLVPKDVMQRWKVALTQAANLSGWDPYTARSESNFIDDIAQDILIKLDCCISSDCDNKRIVGIDEHIAQIMSLLQLESEAVRIIGIEGLGGIGKTTLARALHNNLGTQFSSRSLIVNAQQEIDRDGTYGLRKKYVSELLDEGNTSRFSDERLKRARVLLIIDDVKDSSQIQELIGGRENFGQGSRIIVTSRDLQVLKNADADEIYEVKKMNFQDSQKLFSLYAFKQIYPVVGYEDLVEKILKYAKGVPLALQVLGSLLYGKTWQTWKSELQNLKKFPAVEIFSVLKLSYDGLDDEQKDIFLDITCFYGGDFVDKVVELLDSCGFSADIGMNVLKDRGLISILEDRIAVHDLVLEMGREIVRQQCVNDPGKHSHLWNHEEIYHVLRKNKGTDAIQCIFLDMCRIEKVQLHPQIFKSMPNVRMLYFHNHSSFEEGQSNVIIPDFLESLPNGLKVLHWDEFPQRSLPLDFCSEKLVKLHMRESRLEQLWGDVQELPNLERLDLSNSWKLVRIPDLSKSPNIKEIILSGCESLTSLPINLYKLKFLERLNLSGCSSVKKIPEIKETMENLAVLVLDQTAIQELPSSLNRLVGLEELSLEFCSKLEIIPSSIRTLTKLCKLDLTCCESLETFPDSIFDLKLTKLDLKDCSRLKTFPEILEPAESFAHISLAETAIKKLPSSLQNLVGLQTLCLKQCRDLESLPNSICNLNLLYELDCSGCGKLTGIPNDIGRLSSLRTLSLQDTGVVNLPESIAHLSSLESLDVSNCRKLECIPQLPPFLKQLLAFHCPSIRSVMSNSRFLSDSKEGTFELYFTNNEKQDPGAQRNVVDNAKHRITDDAYRFAFYCFPGSEVPYWFDHHCKRNSVTVDKGSLNLSNGNRLIGFAMCFVLQLEDMNYTRYRFGNFRCRLTFESDGHTHILPIDDQLNNSLYQIDLRAGHLVRDHTFIWKYYLMDSASNHKGIIHAHNFTFEISNGLYLKSSSLVKDCGIYPLYSEEKDDDDDDGNMMTIPASSESFK